MVIPFLSVWWQAGRQLCWELGIDSFSLSLSYLVLVDLDILFEIKEVEADDI